MKRLPSNQRRNGSNATPPPPADAAVRPANRGWITNHNWTDNTHWSCPSEIPASARPRFDQATATNADFHPATCVSLTW